MGTGNGELDEEGELVEVELGVVIEEEESFVVGLEVTGGTMMVVVGSVGDDDGALKLTKFFNPKPQKRRRRLTEMLRELR